MLLSVFVLSAIGVAVSTTLLSLSISSAQTTITTDEAQKAKALANTCAELGLEQIIVSVDYIGSGVGALGSGTCTYTVAALDPSTDVITAVGMSGQVTRKVKVMLAMPGRSIITWQEVSDF